MMTPQDILNQMTTKPFEPFRIHTASGREFEIRHPEFVKVGLTTITVFTPLEGESGDGQKWEEVSLMLVESIAPLDLASRKNGRSGNSSQT